MKHPQSSGVPEPDSLELPQIPESLRGIVPRRGLWLAVGLFISSLAALAAYDIGSSSVRKPDGHGARGMPLSGQVQGPTGEAVGAAPSVKELAPLIESVAVSPSPQARIDMSGVVASALPAGPLPGPVPGKGLAESFGRSAVTPPASSSDQAQVERVAQASVSAIFSLADGNAPSEVTTRNALAGVPARRAAPEFAVAPTDSAVAGLATVRSAGDPAAEAWRWLSASAQNPAQQSRASRDEAWLKEYAQGRTAEAAWAEEPASAWMIFQGTRIPVVTREALNSDLPGQVTAVSTAPVYDSIQQCALMIPQGARFVGQYSSDIRAGQSRMLLAFRRMILPDGRSVQLSGAQAVDQAGRAGVGGDIDNHFLQMFGYGFAIAWIADRLGAGGSAVTVTQPNGQSTSTTVAGQVLADTSTRILNRNAVIPPTLTVDPGARMFVTVTRDMALQPLGKGRCS